MVEAASPYEPAQDTLEVLGTVLVAGIGAALLLSIGGAYFLAGAALRPIDAVTSAAREMGEATSRSGCPWPIRGRGRASRHHDKRFPLAPGGRLRPQGRSPGAPAAFRGRRQPRAAHAAHRHKRPRQDAG